LLQLKKWAWKTHKLVNLFLAWVPIPKSVQMLQSSHPWPWNFLFFHELSAFVWQISYKSRNTNTPTKFQNWYLGLLFKFNTYFSNKFERERTVWELPPLKACMPWSIEVIMTVLCSFLISSPILHMLLAIAFGRGSSFDLLLVLQAIVYPSVPTNA